MEKKRKRKKKNSSASAVAVLLVVLLLILLLILGVLLIGGGKDEAKKKLYPVKYAEEIAAVSEEFGVPEPIICAVVRTESGFDPEAVSRVGAKGLMQLMPATVEWVAWRLNEPEEQDRVFEPVFNLRYGTYLLSFLYERFGDWETAFAGFNAGYGRVQEWLEDPGISENGKLISIPFPETEAYVKKVSKAAEEYERLYFSNKGETENG